MCVFLLVLFIPVCVFSSTGFEENQFQSGENTQIGLNEHSSALEVNAASKVKVKVWYKHWYKKWYKRGYKHWYKSHGRWRYTWRYTWRYKWKYTWKYKYVYKKASVSKVGAYKVVVTSKYVYATGRCSCSLYTDYNYHTRVFKNYNPSTKRWGVLKFEQGPAPKTSPEGMWVATDTDMDFCLVHGKSHDKRGVYLVPYNGVINGIKVLNGYFTNIIVKPATNSTTNSTKTTNSTNTTNSTKGICV